MEKRIMENTARGVCWRGLAKCRRHLPWFGESKGPQSASHPKMSSRHGEKYKPVIEIFSNDIISGQFNTHGVSVEKDKDPCPVVGDGVP
ncbi:hypothetical protein G4B88_024830 [Cannabis sativa]|uniref:Uncharacterized protein n=1 Tax=Cannabis sativa TaxID=3483 RepID=A0A7J6DQ47_CANSA|nr:hypothetical protein G4B88_024830 [Cannabis sativa]